jgi:hypothetical protein
LATDLKSPRERFYRRWLQVGDRAAFRVTVKETDLHIQADKPLAKIARESVLQQRSYIESYGERHPEFLTTLQPWRHRGPNAPIVRAMIAASIAAGVGPMAAVAGAVAERVGRELCRHSREVVVENGGDIFVCTRKPLTMGVFAGHSPLSMQVGIRIGGDLKPVGVCTSSGTVGHSLSRGRADAVCVVAADCSRADAVATAVGNRVQGPADLQPALDFGRSIDLIDGLLVILGKRIGCWGRIELVALDADRL